MNIQIHGDNLDITPGIKKLVNTKIALKLEKLLSHFSPDLKIADLKISKDKYQKFLVNFDMQLPGKKHIFAKNSHIDLESALVDLQQQLEHQIKKYRQDLVNYSLG